ncbi:MAG: ribonuclease H, partial [Chloroflexi bacterium]|nr:ribonuclease H [Chloroflexota bacterium]
VDAAASGPRGPMQYRGVRVDTEQEVFRRGPFPVGTGNIGEFLAIVDALRWLDARGLDWPVYSDSKVARGWVQKGRCRTQLPRTPQSQAVFDLIADAERWLAAHPQHAPVLIWHTRTWGEIPADFNRK